MSAAMTYAVQPIVGTVSDTGVIQLACTARPGLNGVSGGFPVALSVGNVRPARN